jgi:hypothetical protein
VEVGGTKGVLEAVGVYVGVYVFVGGGCEAVQVGGSVAVDIIVGVLVFGRNGVLVRVGVCVSVGVREVVPVRISGVWLAVAVNRLSVSVIVEVIGVTKGVKVVAVASGASCTATQPRQ